MKKCLFSMVLATMLLLFSNCTRQQAKHQDKSTKDYTELNLQISSMAQLNPHGAIALLDSLEQEGSFPIEVIDIMRGKAYYFLQEIAVSASYWHNAFNEKLYQIWPYGYYYTAYLLSVSMTQRDNVEGALRIATENLKRISTETDPELEPCKWKLMERIGLCYLRLRQFDEAEKILEKNYEGLRELVLKRKDLQSSESFCILCTFVIGEYIAFLPDKLPLWFDRAEEAIRIFEQVDISGQLSERIEYHKSRLLSNKAQYYGYIGKLKEAKEFFDEYLKSDIAQTNETIVDKFNYYYFSKQWDKAADCLHTITDLHYRLLEVKPTLTNLSELGLSFRVYENAGRYDDAIEMGRMMANMVDSVKFYHMKDQAAEMAALYETKEKDAEIARQQIDLSHQRLIGLLIAIVLLTIFFIIYTLHRRRAAKRLADVKAAQERIESELRIARDIQMSMVPSVFPEREGLDMYASMTPAKEVGGDLYGYLMLPGGSGSSDMLYFALGDVSGKGVPASLFMAQATRLFLTLAKQGMMPAEICTRMNDALSGDDNVNGMFVTFWLGLLDLQTGHLDFCNAGHNPPVIGGGDHHGDFLEMVPNAPIGLWPGLEYEGESIDTIKGRALFIYTDGLNEAENPQQEQFGDDRLLDILRHTHFDTAQQVIESLKAEVEVHRNGAEPNDDLTMMCVRVS